MKSNDLIINVEGKDALVEFGNKKARIFLYKKPLLRGIDKVARDVKQVSAIQVSMRDASFSITRQVVAMVNTLAWVLKIKVNGKKQIKAEYSKEPNIT